MSTKNPYHYPGDGRHGDGQDTYAMGADVYLRRLLLANKREADKRNPDHTNKPTVYVVQRHVSQSGMRRYLALYVNVAGVMHDVTRYAADALGWKLNNNRDGLIVDGAGMDMHFHTVYSLGRSLYPKGNTNPANPYDGHNAGYMLTHTTL